MQRFTWHRSLYVLGVILGLLTASCVTQERTSPGVISRTHSVTTTEPKEMTRAVVQTAAGNLPLSFEVNQGQSNEPVQFLSHNRGYSVSLTSTEATIILHSPSDNTAMGNRGIGKKSQGERRNPQATNNQPQATTLRLQLVGANSQATASGIDELPGRVNYISGQDTTKWHTNIPTYAKVQYENVYPGVNLLYYGNNRRRLEYDFQVAPGADPTRIRLQFAGVDKLDVDATGDLVLHVAGGELRQHRPQIYQDVAGVRQTISGGYVLTESHEVGFAIGPYDTTRRLIIDPTIAYSTFLGGVSGDPYSHIDKDEGNDITVDAAGNIYVVGSTNSLGRYDTDVFVRKFNPSGSTLLYQTYLDSNGTHDLGYGIAVDLAGNAYVTGQFGDPVLPGWAFGAFVAKLNPAGVPLYEVTFGAGGPGYSQDYGVRIAADDAGNAYVVGTSYPDATPFPTTTGAFQQSSPGGSSDAFVVKLNPSGGFVYSTLLGSSGADEGTGIAIRKAGSVYNAYVTGVTSLASNFPTTAGALQRTFGGASDVFVTQLNHAGSALVYSTYLGGNGRDEGHGIAVDAVGNAYLTGWTGIEPLDSISRFPIVNAFQPIYGGQGGATPAAANAFVAKLNPTGSALIYSSYMGGGGYALYDIGIAIKVDAVGNAYLTGLTGTDTDIFTGASFPIVNAFQPERASSYYDDAFVAKVSPQGALVYSSYLGGLYTDEGHGIAVDASGNVYVTGVTNSEDFPITPRAFQPQISGGGCSYTFQCPDAFVTKIAENTTLTVTKSGTGSGMVTSSPAGISCGTDCSETYTNGTVVTLTATPGSGSTFVGWSGSCTGTGTCAVTMSTAKTVTATFTAATTVSINATDANATEAGRTTGTFTVTRTGSTAAALTVYYTVSGQATATSDYTALSGRVSIPAGATAATIVVTPMDDTVTELSESVTVNLTANAAYVLTAARSVSVIIQDNDTKVSITATDATATEALRTTGTFTVTRVGNASGALTVCYTVTGTTTAGSDYTALSGSVAIPSGATTATIVVTPVDDTLTEGNETVIVRLSSNSAYTVTTPNSATVTISSNE